MMYFQKPPLGTPLDWGNPLNDETALHLAMNEGHGDKVQDLSMNGNDGTLHSMAFPPTTSSGWNPGESGVGLKFDGSNDQIDCANGGRLNITDKITVSGVVNIPVKTNYGPIMSKNPASDGYYMLFDDSADQKVMFIIKQGGVSRIAITNSGLPIATWTLLTGTYDGARVRIFVDGVEQTSGTNTTGNIDSNNGSFKVFVNNAATAFTKGSIDQPRIQSRAWSAKEVKDYAINPWQVYLDE